MHCAIIYRAGWNQISALCNESEASEFAKWEFSKVNISMAEQYNDVLAEMGRSNNEF